MTNESQTDATQPAGATEALAHGKLTIFFGYAAGVGKTYAMLEEAHQQLAHGVDVVVGYVEPHLRPETTALLDGLPSIPPKIIDYRGVDLYEFDLDAALERHPQLIVVDELAHSNTAGVRNAKRYQDVEELLHAGIDVYTTVNVQHIESLNNVIADATKVPVRETVPDYIFEHADRMRIVDIEPDDLLRRMEEGKIYAPDRARAAAENFFTRDNLRVLREAAVREAASHISHDNQAERHVPEKPPNSKLLVYIDATPASARPIRWTARMADALFVPWVAVYVEEKDQDLLSETERKQKRANVALAEKLGAEVVTLAGTDVPEVISEYARATGITCVVVSKTLQRPFRSDLADHLLTLLPNAEMHFIPDDTQPVRPYRFTPEVRVAFSWADTGKMFGLLVAATLLSFAIDRVGIGEQNVIMIYLLSVLIISRITTGFIYGVIASVLSVLAFNFFFIDPLYTFTVMKPGYPVTFVIMLVSALLTSALTVRVKAQVRLAVKREQRTQLLYEIGRTLLVTRGRENIVRVTNDYIVQLFGRSVIFYTDFKSEPQVLQAPGEHADFLRSDAERAAANWTYVNQKPCGAGTETFRDAGALYLPVESKGESLGVIGVSVERTSPSTFSRYFLQTIISQVAMALERQKLSDAQHGVAHNP